MITTLTLALIFYLVFSSIEKNNLKELIVYDKLEDVEGRDFVLFLRSFEEDDIKRENSFLRNTSVLFPFGLKTLSEEMNLSRKLKMKLPVIKVLDQKKESLEPGGDRLILKSEWKEKVIHLMQKAQFIVIKPSNSEGIKWELEQVLNLELHEKTIIMLSFGKGESKEIDAVYKTKFIRFMKEKMNINLDSFPFLHKYMTIDKNKTPNYFIALEHSPPFKSWKIRNNIK